MEETPKLVIVLGCLMGTIPFLIVGWWVFEKIVTRRLTNATKNLCMFMREHGQAVDKNKEFALCRAIVQYLRFVSNWAGANFHIREAIKSLELRPGSNDSRIILYVFELETRLALRIGEATVIDVRDGAKGVHTTY